MGTLWITELANPALQGLQVSRRPAIAKHVIAADVESRQSEKFSSGTYVIRITADVSCHLCWGDDPSASAEDELLPAGCVEYVLVTPGHRVAVIAN